MDSQLQLKTLYSSGEFVKGGHLQYWEYRQDGHTANVIHQHEDEQVKTALLIDGEAYLFSYASQDNEITALEKQLHERQIRLGLL